MTRKNKYLQWQKKQHLIAKVAMFAITKKKTSSNEEGELITNRIFYNTASRSIRAKPLSYGQRKIDWGEYSIIPVGCSQINSLLVRV